MTEQLKLSRPYAPPGNSPGALLGLICGPLGLLAGISWALGKSAMDASSERLIMSSLLAVAIAVGWFTRRFGAAAAVPPAAAAFCLGIIAAIGLDRPFDAHDRLLLTWLVALVIASVALGLLGRKSDRVPNLLLGLLPTATVENDGVQWVVFAPPTQLRLGANPGLVIYLENCHDHERHVAVALRQVGTALIGGKDRVARVAADIAIPAAGFAEVRLPLLVSGEGSGSVNVWVSVGARPRTWRARVKPGFAAIAQSYRPMLSAAALAIHDLSQLGFGFVIRDDQPPSDAPREASARVLDEQALLERLTELGCVATSPGAGSARVR